MRSVDLMVHEIAFAQFELDFWKLKLYSTLVKSVILSNNPKIFNCDISVLIKGRENFIVLGNFLSSKNFYYTNYNFYVFLLRQWSFSTACVLFLEFK